MKLNFNPLQRNPLARNPRIPEATAAIKNWTRDVLDIDEEAIISVNELSCPKPGCPPRETIVLVLRSGAPAMRISIHKAIIDVSEQDVIDARLNGVDTLQAKGAFDAAS